MEKLGSFGVFFSSFIRDKLFKLEVGQQYKQASCCFRHLHTLNPFCESLVYLFVSVGLFQFVSLSTPTPISIRSRREKKKKKKRVVCIFGNFCSCCYLGVCALVVV